MRYNVRVRKRIRNVRVYTVAKRLGSRQNALTGLFERVFNPKGAPPERPRPG